VGRYQVAISADQYLSRIGKAVRQQDEGPENFVLAWLGNTQLGVLGERTETFQWRWPLGRGRGAFASFLAFALSSLLASWPFGHRRATDRRGLKTVERGHTHDYRVMVVKAGLGCLLCSAGDGTISSRAGHAGRRSDLPRKCTAWIGRRHLCHRGIGSHAFGCLCTYSSLLYSIDPGVIIVFASFSGWAGGVCDQGGNPF
jgi:hypothetical protein